MVRMRLCMSRRRAYLLLELQLGLLRVGGHAIVGGRGDRPRCLLVEQLLLVLDGAQFFPRLGELISLGSSRHRQHAGLGAGWNLFPFAAHRTQRAVHDGLLDESAGSGHCTHQLLPLQVVLRPPRRRGLKHRTVRAHLSRLRHSGFQLLALHERVWRRAMPAVPLPRQPGQGIKHTQRALGGPGSWRGAAFRCRPECQ